MPTDTIHTIVYDTIHTVSFDTVHVLMDSSITVQALKVIAKAKAAVAMLDDK